MRKTLMAFSLAALTVGTVQADPVHTFDWDRDTSPPLGGSINDYAGTWEEIHASYDEATEELHWEATWSAGTAYSGILPESFALVINNGPMPTSGNVDDHAIFYFDTSSGTEELLGSGGGPILTAVVYDGTMHSVDAYETKLESSYLNPSWASELIATDNGDGTRTLGFTIDATSINNAFGGSWFGTGFGDPNLGVWFNAYDMKDYKSSYHTDYTSSSPASNVGYLASWGYKKKGWFDVSNVPVVTDTPPDPEPGPGIPEPLTAGLAAVSLGMLAMRRRRHQG